MGRPQTRGRRRRRSTLAALALGACLLVLGPASAFPGPRGGIAFATDRDGNFEIYLVNADGTDATNLTNSAGTSDRSPAFSADRAKIAFVRDGNVYQMASDGSGATALTTDGGTEPSWSPDGTRFAFVRGGDVWIGGGTTADNLTESDAAESSPAWSPDGGTIAFARDGEVWSVPIAGGAATQLTDDGGIEPSWSPDGTQLAFISDRDGSPELYVMDADGDDETRLTEDALAESAPAWSPDGGEIAFAASDGSNTDLLSIPAAGGTATPLQTGAGFDGEPDWGVGGAPANASLPTVTGTATVGSTLTGARGTWSGTSPLTYAYQWRRCDASGGACVDIAGATATTYTVTAADTGFTLRLAVTATNDDGPTSAESAATAVVTATGAPVNVSLPTITGTATVGSTLTGGQGTWSSPSPITYAYQWRRCDASGGACAGVAGATATTYTLTAADAGFTLRLAVTATNADGATTVESAATAVVAATGAPVNTSLPTISGTAAVGSVLTSSTGTWTGTSITYTRRWQRCDSGGSNCVDIAGATGTSYAVTAGDAGARLRVAVTATNAAGSATANSAVTAVVAAATAPANTVAPSISGTPRVGSLLTSLTGTWSGTPPPTYSRQWQRCDSGGANCTDISGATSSSYTPSADMLGARLRVVITATNAGGSATATSAATAAIAAASSTSTSTSSTVNAPRNTATPRITGTPVQGSALTALPGTWSGVTPITYAYVWERCDAEEEDCDSISGATRSTYTLTAGDVGFRLRVVVTATNSAGTGYETSDATDVVRAGSSATTSNRPATGTAGSRKTVRAKGKTIRGTKRRDVLLGGAGNDVFYPNAGEDVIVAGGGNDVVFARDAARDVVVCGAGVDRVVGDGRDVLRGCERVVRWQVVRVSSRKAGARRR